MLLPHWGSNIDRIASFRGGSHLRERFLTVKDDIHDIGMNLISASLATTMPYIKMMVDALDEEGIRQETYVIVGGVPVTENFAREVGADAYGRDAAVSVEIAKSYMARKNKAARDVRAAQAK